MSFRIWVFASVVFFLISVMAMADSAGPSDYWAGSITSPVQSGQDVHIDIHMEMQEYGDEPKPADILLWRINRWENKKLIQDSKLIATGSYTAHGMCHAPNPNCAAHPENCDDCDGDGVNECPKFYCESYDYSLTDACVPPGKTWYDLSSTDWSCLESIHFDVEDKIHACGTSANVNSAGDMCHADDDNYNVTIPDDDTNENSNDKGDDDGTKAGCGGCSVEGSASGLPLAVVMLVIGLAAMIFSMRKKRG